jgi:hypothetical protein
MRRYSLTGFTIALTLAVSLVMGTSGAQAVVVDMSPGAAGLPSVTYPTDQGSYYGVALVPQTRSNLVGAGIPVVTSNAPCTDPALTSDLFLPSNGLCWHSGGSVVHGNETFALVWQPIPYKQYAAPYVEQFLRDVADGSGTLTSPYAETTQYMDPSGRVGNTSLYSGGYSDATAYPANGCTNSEGNPICLTDAQLKPELAAMVAQNRLAGRIQPGYTPLLVLITPPGVEVCLDAAAHLCSANSDSTHVPAQFCSYHSQFTDPVSGVAFAYVVQPWTALTKCDEPDVPVLTGVVATQTWANNMGARLVSPLSQAEIATLVNPGLNGWFALDGSEVNDNGGCMPVKDLDTVTVGHSPQNPYYLQGEFNNGGAIVNDPFSPPCAPNVGLDPNFVVPSPINNGDVVEFDGSEPHSTLLVPRANFRWDFGDGTTAVGPSAVHSFAKGGTYTVTLQVTDRGGNVATISHQAVVLGPGSTPVTPPPPKKTRMQAHMQLMPQGLRAVLRTGVAIRVTCNEPANGIVTLSISRNAAKRANIRAGRGKTVVIGRGTTSGIKDGTVSLHLRLSRATAAKLRPLTHVNLTVRLALVAAGKDHVAIVAAGRY